MKALFGFLAAFFMIALLVPDTSEAARRLGGARSLGTQRAVTPPPQRAAPSQQQGAQQAAPATQQQPRNRWLAPLAGLAAGLGLGYLFSQGGFGAAMAAVLMALLAGFVVFALLKLLARPRQQPLQYAGIDREREPFERTPAPLASASAAAPSPAQPARVPAGFDTAAFLKQAKLNFIRLQDANDRRDLNALREVMTEPMFDAILADLEPENGAPRHTDVVNLEADLLEVVTEGDTHWASVRFTGTIREDAQPEPFTEVWHLQKPVTGNSGWLLSGIQQAA